MYIDPGLGSVIFQVVLAAILAVGVAVKIFWKNIKSFFGKKNGDKTNKKD